MMQRGLSRTTKLGYGVCDLGGNLFFTMVGFFLLYYLTDVVKLSPALAGTALLIGKAWDAISDPIVGYLSDRTVSPLGRRRPYMLYGALFLFVFMIIMFFPMRFSNDFLSFLWYSVLFCVLSTAYTMVNIPYSALAPELTVDYHERTVLNAYRNVFAILGTFSGALLVLPLVGLFSDYRVGWPFMGGVLGLIMLLSAFVTVFTVRESPPRQRPPQVQILRAYVGVLSLRSFRLALATWTLHIMGVTIIQSALVYYFTYLVGDTSAFQITLFALLLTALIAVPFWVWVSKRAGKRFAWNAGMLVFAGAVLAFVFLGRSLGLPAAYVFIVLGGFGFSTQYVIPYAVLPDIVEYDYAKNGIRREGLFYGMWTFMSKVGQALALALSGWILSLFHYVPPSAEGVPQVQPPEALFGISLLVGPLPAVLFVVGVLVFLFYPITREFYEKILKMVEERSPSHM
ncbi:sugar (Glycoside-Pentoside-Hexuronide) transporter [Spirochaeta thermophila DSM 6578]|uniref:Sugar (Glycoside-Pentoside-Hexuronide) transporter n=1 Tax=Winmispira thermophila (strain ATCC 700085 / DSM 6578 / Z-1203) TaxID=869211 RepID=G0GFY5_WINT7|nr:MFS transporter [Spirochaeta thermophila]AEJ62461.1 sugar (Glycoside-Pentoside-Hexuronide) transporter [Spirochaeta thermophila DSM 6578]